MRFSIYYGSDIVSRCFVYIGLIVLFGSSSLAGELKNRVYEPKHYGGTAAIELTLFDDGTVRRSLTLNTSGGNEEWVVEKDGAVVMQRNAGNDSSYRYFRREPGVYKVYIRQVVDGEYVVISNVVGYIIQADRSYIGLIETPPKIEVGTALLKLPLHENYHEVEYQVISGRAVYQGDIDLGSVSEVNQLSVGNLKSFRTGLLSKNLLRLKENTQYQQLKDTLQVESIGHYISSRTPQLQPIPRDPTLRSAFTVDQRLIWPDGEVPYVIREGDFSSSKIRKIEDAISTINDATVVNIIPKTDQHTDYIEVIVTEDDDIGGSSRVGRGGGEQLLRLNNSASKGTIMHEFLHALGLYHTQSRWDRDTYVCVDTSRADSDHRHNFDLHDDVFDVAYGPYDFESIMHYRSCAFSSCSSCTLNLESCATILPRRNNRCDTDNVGGQRSQLQQSDIDAIDWLYGDLGSIGTAQNPLPKTVFISINRLTTINGPEESGWFCNDDMDYFAILKIAKALRLDAGSRYAVQSYASVANQTTSVIEGNAITPSNWAMTLPLREDERYAFVEVAIWDDDKRGAVGVGRCGADDDPVSVQNFDTSTHKLNLLIDTRADDDDAVISQIERMATVATFDFEDVTALDILPGQAMTFRGRSSSSHSAEITLTVDVR